MRSFVVKLRKYLSCDEVTDRDNTYCAHKETLTQKVWHSCASRTDPFAKPSDKVCFCVAKYAEFSE